MVNKFNLTADEAGVIDCKVGRDRSLSKLLHAHGELEHGRVRFQESARGQVTDFRAGETPRKGQLDEELINALAENERLSAMARMQQMKTTKVLNKEFGNLLLQSVRSPWALPALPVKLLKTGLRYCRKTSLKSLGGKDFDAVISAYGQSGFETVDKLLSSQRISPIMQANAYTALGKHLLDIDIAAASKAAHRAYHLDPKAYRLKWLAFTLYKSGDLIEAEAMLDLLPSNMPFSESEMRLGKHLRSEAVHARQRQANLKIGYSGRSAENERQRACVNNDHDEAECLNISPRLTGKNDLAIPKVSIIIPVFNAGESLDASIASVRYQTYQDIELIVVDDASTDISREIIKAHADLDKRIRAVYLDCHTPGGGGIPRNIGVDAAVGTYIGFINAGDYFTKTAIEKLVATAEQYQADIVMGGGRTFTEDACDLQSFDTLPTSEVFSATTHPEVFRTSTLACQKLYRRDFLRDNRIACPEGDYFCEENIWHWFVLASHSKIVKINDIISYCHMSCEDQMIGVADDNFAAICCHLNTIAGFLIKYLDFSKDQSIVDAFYEYCCRIGWIWRRQEGCDVKAILGKRVAQIVEKSWMKMQPAKIPLGFGNLIKEFSDGYPQYDLTVVIPAYNCEAFIEKAVLSVLNLPGIRANVLAMDDGSDDHTAEICQKIEDTYVNFHFFQQKNRGAGSARNALIPLCTGTYTFFLDADDVVNGVELARAVLDAKANDHDLYFLKYQIEFYEKHRIGGMFNQDKVAWNSFPEAKDIKEFRRLALSMVNHPWNRIIKTRLLHDEDIFFGTGSFSEDVLFNWESVLAATHIGYGNEVVVTYRKFERRPQLTNIRDRHRLTAFDMLEFAQHRIAKHENSAGLLDIWKEAMKKRMKWLKELTPNEFHQQFEKRRIRLMNLLLDSFEEKMGGI
ncbi:glycosyltransferase family 2 protein [Paraburkholderia fungorum]|uniref:glycosyltransferase family 2 protein n=1 Tax=Paraburkholderia fungorum TaxID=134537 RepID=UPI0038BC0DE0